MFLAASTSLGICGNSLVWLLVDELITNELDNVICVGVFIILNQVFSILSESILKQYSYYPIIMVD